MHASNVIIVGTLYVLNSVYYQVYNFYLNSVYYIYGRGGGIYIKYEVSNIWSKKCRIKNRHSIFITQYAFIGLCFREKLVKKIMRYRGGVETPPPLSQWCWSNPRNIKFLRGKKKINIYIIITTFAV